MYGMATTTTTNHTTSIIQKQECYYDMCRW